MSTEHMQLQAGGLVPANAKLGRDDAVETVVARAYRHAVLPGRTVIRLTAENVAVGDDLEMATLGFSAGEDRGVVAKERKRPLGFPGWALVHDPQNARYALDVVKELKKHARKAKSKPGHAKDGIDAIAEKLGRTAPHFLPSFYEEAGRVFIEHGAPSFAAAMFGKAREAEAVHALEVDEQHRVDGFLEFALAGAVTTKALTQYAKELGEHHKPDVAYGHFRQLCLQRTLGGMPPWSGMAKELRRLAKAAKKNVADEDRAFVAEIVESPALGKAAGEFWRAYAEPITELGKSSPVARGALLNLFPTGTGQAGDLDEAWLDLVESTGAVQALVADGAPHEARPNGGRAAWFDKLTSHLARDYRSSEIGDRAFALLRRMAPMLIADGKPINCTGRSFQIDLDLCELALELGVPVAPPPQYGRFNLDGWSKRASMPGRGRDPVRTAAHPVLAPLLAAAVAAEIGDEPFDTVSRGKPGFLAAKRMWLESVIEHAERGALVGLDEAIAVVHSKVKAETFSDLPDLHARFAAIDPAPALARSLRIGLVDELGWPALEEAALELDPDGKTELSMHGGPPAVVLATKTRAIAVGPGGRLGTHDLVIPPKTELVTLRFIQGQFLVAIKEGYKARGYWSSRPHDVFDTETSGWGIGTFMTRAAVLTDGAWIEGLKPIRAGDHRVPDNQNFAACDGTTAWATEVKDGQIRWREVSRTGELGRFSWPAFIEAGVDPEWKIHPASYVLPGPNGLVGVRARYQGTRITQQTKHEIETIDGLRVTSTEAPWPTNLVRLPGSAEPRLVVEASAWREGVTTTLFDPASRVAGCKIGPRDRRYLRGQVAPLPSTFWHLLTPRDEAGSRCLRTVSDDDARALIAVIPVEGGVVVDEAPADLIASVLPDVTHPRLRAGVVGFAMIAAKQKLERDRLVAERAPGTLGSRPAGEGGPDDALLFAALGGWIERQYAHRGSAWMQIARTGQLFAQADHADRIDDDMPASTFDWLKFAVMRSSLAYLALAVGTAPEDRKAIAELFAVFARTLPAAEKLRTFQLDTPPWEMTKYFQARWHGGNAYAIRKIGYGADAYRVLEYAPTGTFKPPPVGTVSNEVRGAPGALDADAATALLAAVADGDTSWSKSCVDRLVAATGLTFSEAAYLWAGCPKANDRSANFLAKEVREEIGLKATQAAIARDSLNGIPLVKRLAAIDEAARAGIAALIDGSAVDTLAAAWNRLVGARVPVPEELIADADRELHAPIQPSAALAMIGAATEAPELTTDGIWALDKTGEVIRASKPEPLVQEKTPDDAPVFTDRVLHTAVMYLPFLYAELPVGHELRAKAVTAYELVQQRLANKALWVEAGQQFLAETETAAFDRLLDSLGGEPIRGLDEGITGRLLPGAVVVRARMRAQLKLRPALIDARAATTVGKLAAQIPQWGFSAWKSLEYFRSPGLAQMMARITTTPVPVGSWEHNPLVSVPTLVDKVAKQLGVSKDAAALYLQYLTLLWPTPKNIQQWNGWKSKQFEAANAELLDQELILEAKRERAQRQHFLPGGWEALKSPHPPMESWKLALYGLRNPEGDPVPPLGRFLALAPLHSMFEVAWERIENKDTPRYDEVKR